MTADFHGGQFADEPLPVRVCSCHILPDREGDEFVPQCEDDEERVCTALTAKLTGTYANDDCDDEDCLASLHASLELPPGFEFDGRVRLVHEEEWYSDSSHQLL